MGRMVGDKMGGLDKQNQMGWDGGGGRLYLGIMSQWVYCYLSDWTRWRGFGQTGTLLPPPPTRPAMPVLMPVFYHLPPSQILPPGACMRCLPHLLSTSLPIPSVPGPFCMRHGWHGASGGGWDCLHHFLPTSSLLSLPLLSLSHLAASSLRWRRMGRALTF